MSKFSMTFWFNKFFARFFQSLNFFVKLQHSFHQFQKPDNIWQHWQRLNFKTQRENFSKQMWKKILEIQKDWKLSTKSLFETWKWSWRSTIMTQYSGKHIDFIKFLGSVNPWFDPNFLIARKYFLGGFLNKQFWSGFFRVMKVPL